MIRAAGASSKDIANSCRIKCGRWRSVYLIEPLIQLFVLQSYPCRILSIPILQSFLNDYGLIWVGDGESSDSTDSEQPMSADSGLQQPGNSLPLHV